LNVLYSVQSYENVDEIKTYTEEKVLNKFINILNSYTVKNDMRELFPQNLFIYLLLKIQKVRNILGNSL
jgi:hypothetical protein